MELGPPEAFGTGSDYSRLAIHKSKLEILFNANTGKSNASSTPSLQPVDVTIESPGTVFAIQGDTLKYEFYCENNLNLERTIIGIQNIFPALLNLSFADPPVVLNTKVYVGDSTFTWEHERLGFNFTLHTQELVEQSIADSIERLSLFHGFKNRSLAAAIHYFYIASRLTVSGHSQWEFMAEAILNFNKVLVILFGDSRDEIRNGLRSFGYEDKEIEAEFIPLKLLRDFLDVGHPRTVLLEKEQLKILYVYLFNVELTYKKLFERIFDKIKKEGITFDAGKLKMDKNEKCKFDRLIEKISTVPRVKQQLGIKQS